MAELGGGGGGEKGDLIISFLFGLSLFLPVESSCCHPVKKFNQKKGGCLVWKNRPTISIGVEIITARSQHCTINWKDVFVEF